MRDLPEIAAGVGGRRDRPDARHHAAGARTPRTEEAFIDGHKELLELARTLSFRHFKRVCDVWTNLADQDGAEHRAARRPRRPRGPPLESFEGMWFGRMTFDPVSGTIVNKTLST